MPIQPRDINVEGELDSDAEEIKNALLAGGRAFVFEMKIGRLSGPTTADSLSARTGALRKTIGSRVKESGTPRLINRASEALAVKTTKTGVAGRQFQLEGFSRPLLPYTFIHEKGGLIVRQDGVTITIPPRMGFQKTFERHVELINQRLQEIALRGRQIRVIL